MNSLLDRNLSDVLMIALAGLAAVLLLFLLVLRNRRLARFRFAPERPTDAIPEERVAEGIDNALSFMEREAELRQAQRAEHPLSLRLPAQREAQPSETNAPSDR